MSTPYIALYPGDFLADTGHLGNTELGIYWRLLLVYYRDGRPLPTDMDRLRRLAMTFSPEECRVLESVVAEFFTLSTEPDGRRVWRHKRADKEILTAQTKHESASKKASAAAEARWKKNAPSIASGNAPSIPEAMLVRCQPEPEPEPEPEQVEERVESNSTAAGAHSDEAPRKRSAEAKKPRAARLPQDWTLPKSWGDWAVSELGMQPAAVRTEAAKFADHWHAKAGRDAAKLDWLATWRNWCRTALERAPRPLPGRQQPAPAQTDAQRTAEVRRLLGFDAIDGDVIEGGGHAR